MPLGRSTRARHTAALPLLTCFIACLLTCLAGPRHASAQTADPRPPEGFAPWFEIGPAPLFTHPDVAFFWAGLPVPDDEAARGPTEIAGAGGAGAAGQGAAGGGAAGDATGALGPGRAADRPDPPKPGRPVGSGRAVWYEHPGRTASGERFDPNRLTAAHRTLPLGSTVRVVNRRNGRSVVVRINDRGPPQPHLLIDLSRASARAIGIDGVGEVALYRLD